MITLNTLKELKNTSSALKKQPIPVELEAPAVKKEMQFLTEMTFIYVLKLLGVEDENQLEKIVSRLREGTFFYTFTHLVYNLAKSITDFDFLTQPENIIVYKKIAEVSDECDIHLLPYVNVLAKIAANKELGLYTENQEIGLFLNEYDKHKDEVEPIEFLRQFKKILKYQTQKIFEQFIKDNIFTIIQKTHKQYEDIINSIHMLTLYVYGLHYYQVLMSNENENLLVSHINFCVSHLASHDYIKFNTKEKQKIFPVFDNKKEAVEYFFEHNQKVLNSAYRFIGLLKDYCSADEVIEFCNFLHENLYQKEPVIFDEDKTKFNKYIAKKIRELSVTSNSKVYKEIFKLLPLRYICMRQPTVTRSQYGTLLIFNDKKEKFLFYAVDNGNLSSKTPEANVFVEVEILKKTPNGYAEKWRWKNVETSINKENNIKTQNNDNKKQNDNEMYTLEECLDMWRDKTAWEYNKKKNEIMDDATLKYIAKNKPLTKAALPKKYHNEMGDEIISIIRNSLYSK